MLLAEKVVHVYMVERVCFKINKIVIFKVTADTQDFTVEFF